jgi:hypothetical protein
MSGNHTAHRTYNSRAIGLRCFYSISTKTASCAQPNCYCGWVLHPDLIIMPQQPIVQTFKRRLHKSGGALSRFSPCVVVLMRSAEDLPIMCKNPPVLDKRRNAQQSENQPLIWHKLWHAPLLNCPRQDQPLTLFVRFPPSYCMVV